MNCPYCSYRIDPDFIYERWYELGYPKRLVYQCPICKELIYVSIEYRPKFKLEKK